MAVGHLVQINHSKNVSLGEKIMNSLNNVRWRKKLPSLLAVAILLAVRVDAEGSGNRKTIVVRPTPQPTRPERPTVDLDDPTACLYELAELASFSYFLNDFEGKQTHAIGCMDFPRAVDILDQTARLAHLRESKDPAFVSLVERVRKLRDRSWQLFAANRDFGATWETESDAMVNLVGSTFLYFAAKSVGQSMRDREVYTYRDANGRVSEHVIVSDEQSALEDTADEIYTEHYQDMLSNRRSRQKFSNRIAAVQGLIQDQLAQLWEDDLLPRLATVAGPACDEPLLTAIEPSKLRKDNTLHLSGFGGVGLRNASRRTLQHVTVQLRVVDNHGDVGVWYGYFPELKRSDECLVLPQGAFAHLMGRTATTATATLVTQNVECTNPPVALQLEQSTMHEGREHTFEELAQRRSEMYSERKKLIRRAGKLLRELGRLYPVPQDPVSARRELLAAIQWGSPYSLSINDGRMAVPTVITFDQINPRLDHLVDAQLTLRTPSGLETTKVLGRIEEEVERGCVLVLDPLSAMPRSRNGRRPRGKDDDPFGVSEFMNQVMPRARINANSWKKREIWQITSPFEIPHFSSSDAMEPRLEPPLSARTARNERMIWARHGWPARCVVFLGENAELYVQGRPYDSGEMPFGELKLEPK